MLITTSGLTDQYPDYIRWSIIDIFFAITVASLPTLNNLVPKSWDQSYIDSPDRSAPKIAYGSDRSDSKTMIADPHIHEFTFTSSQTLTDEEGGRRQLSGSTGVGTQPDWNEYHKEIKVPI